MEAKDLMLNDLIIYRGEIYHVASIDRLGGLVGIDDEDGIELAHESEIEPIPLTAEILEKKGFVSVDNGCKCVRKWNIGEYTYADMSFDFNVEVDMLNGTSSFLHIRVPHIGILGMPLYYVHTLQHALRLCGLTELADSI